MRFSYFLKSKGELVAQITPECSVMCWKYVAVYRVSMAMIIFHGVLALIFTKKISNDSDPRLQIHTRYWIFKFLLWIALIISVFFIPHHVFIHCWIPWLVLSSIFLVIQCVFLIDFTRDCSEYSVDQYHHSKSCGIAAGLILTTLICYAISLFSIIYLFMNAPTPIVYGFGVLHLLLCILTNVVSILPAIQKRNPKTGLLPPAMLSAYNSYLFASAIINASPQPSSLTLQILGMSFLNHGFIGFVLVVFSLGYLVFSFEGGPFEFHLITALVACYMASILTNWLSLDGYNQAGDAALSQDQGMPAMWVKLILTWLHSLLYIWTLIAPILFPNREFY